MKQSVIQTSFFFALLLGSLIAVIFMFAPFLNVIALSAILALTFYPLYKIFKEKLCFGRGAIASLLTIIVILVLVLGPLTWISARVLDESREIYTTISQKNPAGFAYYLESWIEKPIKTYAPAFELDLKEYASSVFKYLATHAGTVLSGAISAFASLILVLIATFFFLKDGPKLISQLKRLSPLDEEDENVLSNKVSLAVNAVVRGVVLVGVVQGFLVGIGFTVFGISNATLWGTLAALLAMVPGLGTGVVTLPAVVFMFVTGNTGSAIGLAVWGFAVVGLVDNFLAPYFYSKGVNIHQLIVLFGVLGGITLFGPLGFIYGPVLLALLHALVSTYRERFLN